MCSYDSINGVPACADDYTLNQMIRVKWNQPHAFVTTDCGAVSNMLGQLEPAPGQTRLAAIPGAMSLGLSTHFGRLLTRVCYVEEAAAWTINNGTDLEMGSLIWTQHMENATKIGLVTEATITRSLRRKSTIDPN